jgi:hypothetical protein
VVTDGWGPYRALPGVYRVAALLKRWLLGTHQGGVEPDHLAAYLDEFVFRFNRWRSEAQDGVQAYHPPEPAEPTDGVLRRVPMRHAGHPPLAARSLSGVRYFFLGRVRQSCG